MVRSVVSQEDQNWRGANMRYAHVLMDRNDDIVTGNRRFR